MIDLQSPASYQANGLDHRSRGQRPRTTPAPSPRPVRTIQKCSCSQNMRGKLKQVIASHGKLMQAIFRKIFIFGSFIEIRASSCRCNWGRPQGPFSQAHSRLFKPVHAYSSVFGPPGGNFLSGSIGTVVVKRSPSIKS
jgi:hypothetical protein